MDHFTETVYPCKYMKKRIGKSEGIRANKKLVPIIEQLFVGKIDALIV